jgi:oxygen-dependent protoporphyrinogen oxidase
MSEGKKILIVGGGLSGLVRAHELVRRGVDVRVFEESETPGGAAKTLEKDGYLLELGPNTVRPTPRLLALCRELGLGSEILLSDPRLPRFIELGGRLRKIPFGALSLPGMVRIPLELFVGRGPSGETVYDFAARRLGREAAHRLIEPFVSGVCAGDARRLVVEEAFPRLFALEKNHRSLILGAIFRRRPERAAGEKPVRGLLSFRRGMAALAKALASSLGDRFRAGVRVEGIERAARGWAAVTSEGRAAADEVVLAVSCGAASRLAAAISPEAARGLAGIPSPPITVAHCSWDRKDIAHPLVGFGHLVVPGEPRRILGAVWSSAIFPGRAPEGKVLITVFLGGRRAPENAALPDEAVVEAVFEDAAEALGAARPPELVHRTSYREAIPQYESWHREVLRALANGERENPGLSFLGNYRGGISVGDVVENAAIIAGHE